jgi:thimet oligopeptidase
MKKHILIAGTALSLVSGAARAAPGADPLHSWLGGGAADIKTWTQARLDEEQAALAKMLAVKGPRTIANTLVPFDTAANALGVAGDQSYLLYAVGDTAELRDAAQALEQTVSTAVTKLSLDRGVYDALAALSASAEAQHADAATRHYLDRTLLEYRLAGVDRDAATRAKVAALQDKITALGLTFGRNVQDGTLQVPTTVTEMKGLPADFIAKHNPAADGKVMLSTEQPDVQPVLKFAADASLRKRMLIAYESRAYPANEKVLKDLLDVRQQLATALGFKTYADFATADQMIGSVPKLKAFLAEVDAASKPDADKEIAQLTAFVAKTDPKAGPLTEADSRYWSEQYRRSAYDFDSQSVRPYFPFAEVQTGVLSVAARLFHLRFEPVKDAAVWDASVSTFDVFDALAGSGGRKLGRIYLDMHPRTGKDKWFSSAPVVPGIAGKQLPEGVLICNFTGGTDADPGLMEYGDVVTFFHEFGHLMHHILGSQGRWSGQGGFNVEGDFIEAPSQMLEEVFHDPTVLQSFAKHYKTGEVLPTALIARMNRASAYGRAIGTQTQLAYSSYSLQIHDQPPQQIDLQALYQQDQRHFTPFQPLPEAHDFASFTHLVGYASNYYTYVLDKVIAIDFFDQFDKANLLDGPTALRYRHTVLEPGASKPAAGLVQDFLGRPQNVEAFKRWQESEFQKP